MTTLRTITPLAELPKEYAAELNQCNEPASLQQFLERWRLYAPDAYTAGNQMGELAFLQFRRGLRRERAGNYAGDEWAAKYGAIVMPDMLTRVTLMAQEYSVPWGAMFLRLVDVGLIVVEEGVFVCRARVESDEEPTERDPDND